MGRNFVQTNASRNSVCFQGQTTKKGIANYAGQNLLSTNTTNRISAAKNVLHGMYVKLKRELDLMLSKRILFANIVEKDTWQYQQGETSTAAKNVCLNPKKKQRFAQFAEKNIRQVNTKNQDFAVLNVLENIILLGEEMKEVYDIEVDKTHEYFANGILVHNCIDAARYWVWGDVLGKIQSGQGYTYRDF
jgi:hypothetical protein